jgi:hypothetical protein
MPRHRTNPKVRLPLHGPRRRNTRINRMHINPRLGMKNRQLGCKTLTLLIHLPRADHITPVEAERHRLDRPGIRRRQRALAHEVLGVVERDEAVGAADREVAARGGEGQRETGGGVRLHGVGVGPGRPLDDFDFAVGVGRHEVGCGAGVGEDAFVDVGEGFLAVGGQFDWEGIGVRGGDSDGGEEVLLWRVGGLLGGELRRRGRRIIPCYRLVDSLRLLTR